MTIEDEVRGEIENALMAELAAELLPELDPDHEVTVNMLLAAGYTEDKAKRRLDRGYQTKELTRRKVKSDCGGWMYAYRKS
jgi:hypothetical protein